MTEKWASITVTIEQECLVPLRDDETTEGGQSLKDCLTHMAKCKGYDMWKVENYSVGGGQEVTNVRHVRNIVANPDEE